MPSPRAAGDSASPGIRVEAVPLSGLSTHSRFRGLTWDKKKNGGWRVRIAYCGKQRHVGRYPDDVTAAKAYDKAAVYLYGSAAVTNFGLQACLQDPTEVSDWIVKTKRVAQQQAAINRLQRTSARLQGTHTEAGSSSAQAYHQQQQQGLHPLPPPPPPPPPRRLQQQDHHQQQQYQQHQQYQQQPQPLSGLHTHALATTVSTEGLQWQELSHALKAQAFLGQAQPAAAAAAAAAAASAADIRHGMMTPVSSSSACIGYASMQGAASLSRTQPLVSMHWSSGTQLSAGLEPGLATPVWAGSVAAGGAGAGTDDHHQQSVLRYAVSMRGGVFALQQQQQQQAQQPSLPLLQQPLQPSVQPSSSLQPSQPPEVHQPGAGLPAFSVHTEERMGPLSRVGSAGSAGSQFAAAGVGMQPQQPQQVHQQQAGFAYPAMLPSPRQTAEVALRLPAAAAAAGVDQVTVMPPWLAASQAETQQQGMPACPVLAVPSLPLSHSSMHMQPASGVMYQQQASSSAAQWQHLPEITTAESLAAAVVGARGIGYQLAGAQLMSFTPQQESAHAAGAANSSSSSSSMSTLSAAGWTVHTAVSSSDVLPHSQQIGLPPQQ